MGRHKVWSSPIAFRLQLGADKRFRDTAVEFGLSPGELAKTICLSVIESKPVNSNQAQKRIYFISKEEQEIIPYDAGPIFKYYMCPDCGLKFATHRPSWALLCPECGKVGDLVPGIEIG